MAGLSNNGTLNVDYSAAMSQRGASGGSGNFRSGSTNGTPYADFDQSYDAINDDLLAGTGTSYTASAGDTLQGIAAELWGDASLWYMIAEANGLSGNEALAEGRVLAIPNKVHNFHNSADTWRPYDPNEALGDLSPTRAPKPKKGKNCGGLGAVLLAVVAVAVAAVATGGALALATGKSLSAGLATIGLGSGTAISGVTAGGFIAAGAAGGAAGSIVSQGLGVATGLQSGFSWKAVGLSAIAGGVGGGIGASGLFGGIGSPVLQSALRGLTASAITQGIGVATGLQDRFSWAGVAAAGVGAGVGSWVGSERVLSGMAGGIAAAAAESLITGDSFGDTLMRSLPSIVGNTIGNIVAEGVAGNGRPRVGGSITGAGDGASAQPTPGAGGDQVGGSVSSDAQPGDIVVAGRRSEGHSPVAAAVSQVVAQTVAGSNSGDAHGAAVESIDRGNHPYPALPEDMSGNTAWQLRAKKGAYLDAVAKSGETFTDNALNVKAFDDLIALADAREAPGVAAANAAEIEILRVGLAPFDIAAGGYNIVTGDGEFRDYLAVAGVVPVGKMLGTVGRIGETATARATRLGAEGEQAVGLFGPKVGIRIPGSNQLRFPDNLTTATLTEVKNVAYQGYTRQLRDFAAYSRSKGLTFELYVRPSTRLSQALNTAIVRGDIVKKYIPGVK